MTPERIEEIKAFIQTLDQKCELAEWLNGLVVALEEAQQQTEKDKIELIELEETHATLQRTYRELDKSSGETLDLLKETSHNLAEAQQTINRYKSALEIIRENTDDQGAIDCVDEAIGNKEGDKNND